MRNPENCLLFRQIIDLSIPVRLKRLAHLFKMLSICFYFFLEDIWADIENICMHRKCSSTKLKSFGRWSCRCHCCLHFIMYINLTQRESTVGYSCVYMKTLPWQKWCWLVSEGRRGIKTVALILGAILFTYFSYLYGHPSHKKLLWASNNNAMEILLLLYFRLLLSW